MRDGLYQVTTPFLCAGFVVNDGRVTACAPILRKRLRHWMTVAVRTADDPVSTRKSSIQQIFPFEEPLSRE